MFSETDNQTKMIWKYSYVCGVLSGKNFCPVCPCCCTFVRVVCVWAYKAKHRCVYLLILLILFLPLLRGRICLLLRQTNGGFGRVLFLQCAGVWWFYYLEFSKYVAWSNVTQKQTVVGSGRQSGGIRKLWHMSQGWSQNWHTGTRISPRLNKIHFCTKQ